MAEAKDIDKPLANITSFLRSKSQDEFIAILRNTYQVKLDATSNRKLDQLYNDLQKGECWFDVDTETNELVRHVDSANIDIFYTTIKGETYHLKEGPRVTLASGDTAEDYFRGTSVVLSIAKERDNPHSVSERMVTHVQNSETPISAAIRGISEEIFSSIEDQVAKNNLNTFVYNEIKNNGFVDIEGELHGKNNSYSGLKSIYHKHNFSINFSEQQLSLLSTDLPIIDINYPPYELTEKSDRNYLNIFRWDKIHEISDVEILDNKGKKLNRIITPENSIEILKEVKTYEEMSGNYDYQLRRRIVEKSNGKIETYVAYTIDPNILGNKYTNYVVLKEYLNNENNWVPERANLHNKIVGYELEKVRSLSESLGDKKPTIYILRGNNGAGKSTLLRENAKFQRAGRNTFDDGVINTDFYDSQLRRESLSNGTETVTSTQVHLEGGIIETKIRNKALADSNLSIIFDKRFSFEKQILEILKKKGDRDMQIFDLEVLLDVSIVRIMGRTKDKRGTDAPVIPFSELVKGFIGIRKNRSSLIDIAKFDPTVTYYLLQETSSSKSRQIAEKKEGEQLEITEGEEEYFGKIAMVDKESVDKFQEEIDKEIERIKAIKIDMHFINTIISSVHENERDYVYHLLERNLGKNLTEVLDNLANLLT